MPHARFELDPRLAHRGAVVVARKLAIAIVHAHRRVVQRSHPRHVPAVAGGHNSPRLIRTRALFVPRAPRRAPLVRLSRVSAHGLIEKDRALRDPTANTNTEQSAHAALNARTIHRAAITLGEGNDENVHELETSRARPVSTRVEWPARRAHTAS